MALQTAAFWEECLKQHFLYTTGPYGDLPLTSLDATPEELREAIGRSDLPVETVAKVFCGLFTRQRVRSFFPSDASTSDGAHALKSFRYLVLTCHVTATSLGAGKTHDFRHRLGELLDGEGPEQSVNGVNKMWKALATHVDFLRSRGEPLRQIQLPNPGSFTLIGHALYLAYPSWSDRRALRSVLGRLSEQIFESRFALITAVFARRYDLPERLRNEVGDLFRSYQRSPSDALRHRTWHLMASIVSEMIRAGEAKTTPLWRLTALFSGWDGDQVEIQLSQAAREGDLNHPSWSGDISDPKLNMQLARHRSIGRLFQSGTFLLQQAGGGKWQRSHRKLRPDLQTILFTCSDRIKSQITTITVGGGWHVSAPMGLLAAQTLCGVGSTNSESDDNEQSFRIESGIPVKGGAWLGRPGYFPVVRVPGNAAPSVTLVSGEDGAFLEFIAAEEDRSYRISNCTALEGTWSLRIPDISSDQRLRLVRIAPVLTSWPDRSDAACELTEINTAFDGIGQALNFALPVKPQGTEPSRQAALEDVMEALYSRGNVARSEGEIVDILSRVVPLKHLVWDVLRSFEEARWIERDVNRRWRGQKWRLLAPQIVSLKENMAILEGAWSALELTKLDAFAKDYSIKRITLNSEPWSAPLIRLEGPKINEMAAAGQWRLVSGDTEISLQTAPHCWFPDHRDGTGHRVAGRWNCEAGLFLPAEEDASSGDLCLERLCRDDDQDLYRIRQTNMPNLLLGSRVAAILEFHRRGRRPMFRRDDEFVSRISRDGYLPLPLAVFLRRTGGAQAGPVLFGEKDWTYRYPASVQNIWVLNNLFGDAFGTFNVSPSAGSKTTIKTVINMRRRGLRPALPLKGQRLNDR